MIINPSHRIGEVKAYYFATKLAEIAEMNQSGQAVINLGIGSPDLLPPSEVIETLQAASKLEDANKYQSYKGLPELRDAYAAHYKAQLSVSIDSITEVLPLIGSKEGIMHIAMSFLSEGDKVLVPNPGYPSYRVTTELAGATPRLYNLTEQNGWRPDLAALGKTDLSKVKIMWINYPNMPTGAKVDLDFYHNLVDFALKHQILICHDNPYNYILNDNPLSIFNVPRAKECAIELFSLSKCYNMAGWRVGALIGAQEYVDVVMRFKSNMDSGMYKAVQLAAVTALNMGQEWFEQLNVEYRERRKLVWQIFDLLDCRYDRDSSGLFVWAKAPDYIADVESWVDEILQDARVFITPGFIFGSNGERYVRIALCSNQATLKNAFNKIDQHFIKSMA